EVIKEIGYLYDLQDLYTRKILDWEDAEKEILKNLSQTPKDGLKYSGIPGFIASAKNFKFMDRD
ncbi:MAG: hypothetical protein IJP87_01590, partial [Campylobacter sp.]|nr:hypothetical protein [Campylobacter sp.]